MRSQGHAHAGRYPLWLVRRETDMARERVDAMLASEMAGTYLMLCAALCGGEASREFNRMLKRLQG